MKSSLTNRYLSKENFHKICVVGGGITGAIMVLLLKNSNLFKLSDIGWVKPQFKPKNDLRTTFYNNTSVELLKNLNILKNLKKKNFTKVNQIKVFGVNHASPLVWNNADKDSELGLVIKNEIILNAIEEQIKEVKQYDSLVNNTECNKFERILYLENKNFIKTHLVLAADGKNSHLRKLLSIKSIEKNFKHIAISGFLKQSRNHNSTAIQAFTDLGPIGILPYDNKNIVNFVQSMDENRFKREFDKQGAEQFLCAKLNNFFSHTDIQFSPLEKINNIETKLSFWKLDLNLILNPTYLRTILIGDAAHSIHPLAGQGLNLSLRDCVCSLNAVENSIRYGNDLGDESILKFYKNERIPKTVAMTAFTDLMFLGFTSTSDKTQTILTKAMENLNKTDFKNIFRDLASI